MIVVIADDFTGAAEIAGLGLRYGLNVVIKLELTTDINTDLLIIATDSRSMNKENSVVLYPKKCANSARSGAVTI